MHHIFWDGYVKRKQVWRAFGWFGANNMLFWKDGANNKPRLLHFWTYWYRQLWRRESPHPLVYITKASLHQVVRPLTSLVIHTCSHSPDSPRSTWTFASQYNIHIFSVSFTKSLDLFYTILNSVIWFIAKNLFSYPRCALNYFWPTKKCFLNQRVSTRWKIFARSQKPKRRTKHSNTNLNIGWSRVNA